MVVVGGVSLAFLATDAAGRRAGFDRCTEEAEIGCGLARDDAAGRVADVGTVEVEPNAADQLLHVFLTEAGVGAARARSGTVETLVDTTQERAALEAGRLGMRVDHLSNGHLSSFLRRLGYMGRAGLEPATLGLKVPCSTN
jgi:hypothetical protein